MAYDNPEIPDPITNTSVSIIFRGNGVKIQRLKKQFKGNVFRLKKEF